MKAGTVILIVGGVGVVGVGGYLLWKKSKQAMLYTPNPLQGGNQLAMAQQMFGSKAVANSGTSQPTLGTVAGATANKFLPGSGAAVAKLTDKAANVAVSAIRSLKFW